MKIRCKKCNDILVGDKKGTYISCTCKACAIDETPYYWRIIGDAEDFEEIIEEEVISKEDSKKSIRTEEDLLKIINHYGVNNQLKHFQSEVWELNEAIFQYEEQKRVCMEFCSRLHCDKEREHIAEEIADVMVMLEQFKAYYGISSEEITEIFWSKVARQLNRIEKENK